MSQKRAKRIRKELNKILPADMPYTRYKFEGGNPDIKKLIEKVGLQRVRDQYGYYPLTCTLRPECKRFHYQQAKKSAPY